MPRERQVYLLDPQKLPQETIAVAFARTSRSPQSFREIAAELTDEKSAEFNERWVVGYGHFSVAEHAVLHIAAENISRLAVETLESNRLASYTEKSTRYQKWGVNDFYFPSELADHPLRKHYIETCQQLFVKYQQLLTVLPPVLAVQFTREENETEKEFASRIKLLTVDVARFLLPAASLANVGMTINARALEYAIKKMLSHQLAEVRELGSEIKTQALSVVPTLLKYADTMPYIVETCSDLRSRAKLDNSPEKKPLNRCQLVAYSADAEENVLAAALYRFSNLPFQQAVSRVKSMGISAKKDLAKCLLGRMGGHDEPLRELEYADFTFDLVLDQGAYYELKRHRMTTQTAQPLSAALGYSIPKAIADSPAYSDYQNVMDNAADVWHKLAVENPDLAAYIVPNGYNRRVLVKLNYRSAYHLLQLRTAPNAHFSIRRIAQLMAEEIHRVCPLLGEFLSIRKDENGHEIESRYFTRV